LRTEELASLSAYLVRLRSVNQALDLLRSARRRDPASFYLQANYALVQLIQGSPEALSEQKVVLRSKPKDLIGMPAEQATWYLRVESALFDLEKLRFKEMQAKGARSSAEKWDELFHVSFVGESGSYEAGTLAEEQKKLLPSDAIAVVQQLLLWLPDDTRLYWLLAELYNAAGKVEEAGTIFDECLNSRGFQPKLLREHRWIVMDETARRRAAAEEKAQQEKAAAEAKNWKNHPEVFWIAGGVLALPLAALLYWQIREVSRRLRGRSPTRH
jgi:tetratricopeptide (TPR) repeat protein